ncbi:hypothetical protein U1Q18_036128 [Sarracenia purpurea var. burkii]
MEMAKVRSERNEDEIKTLDDDEDDDLFWLLSPGVREGNDENKIVIPELQKESGVGEKK